MGGVFSFFSSDGQQERGGDEEDTAIIERCWVERRADGEGKQAAEEKESDAPLLRVISYNILAPSFAGGLKGVAPSSARIEHRLHLLVKELQTAPMAEADIIALQEVEPAIMRQLLRLLGGRYKGSFELKGSGPDGVALLWDDSRLEAVTSRAVPLCEVPDGAGRWLTRRIRSQRHVAQLVQLRERSSGRDVIVCNVHNHWRPEDADVKLLQLAIAARAADAMARESADAPVVLCGDLNSLPPGHEALALQDEQDVPYGSGVYQLLTTGAVEAAHPHHPSVVSDGCEAAVEQPLALTSAYAHVLGAEPEYTNYTLNFKGTLDYLFTTAALTAVAVLSMPPTAVLRACRALPAARFPSDHLPVGAVLRWRA
eukprot:PLAT7878.1.p1 GENE.PLAT7878.1~~PLAT7878.1.p1  ORF type:complete len:370 (+),score=135.29 PLAT7878.1:40-1149(+)